MSPVPDLVVIGGGPAGLSSAIAARLRGLSVVVVEKRRPPLDKACGEGILPRGVAALAALGVVLSPGEGRAFQGIRYLDAGQSAEATFGNGAVGWGVRRTTLIAALVRRAEEIGVELRWGEEVTGVRRGAALTEAGETPARFVVGADGLRSRVRGWAGLAGQGSGRRRFGVRRHLRIRPWSDFVEVHWGEGCEGYVTPVGEEEVGVALLWEGEAGGFDDLLTRLPALAARLAGAESSGSDRGAGPFEQRVRRAVSGRIALVGDAAGYLDALTGEGLALAFASALDLADALANGDLRAYARALRRRLFWPQALTRGALVLRDHPQLRRRVIRGLAADPELFTRILALATGSGGLAALGARRVARFAGHLARR